MTRKLSEYQGKEWMQKISLLDRKFPDRKGELNPNRKLSWDQVNTIRGSGGSLKAVAERFGISESWASKIKRKLVWI